MNDLDVQSLQQGLAQSAQALGFTYNGDPSQQLAAAQQGLGQQGLLGSGAVYGTLGSGYNYSTNSLQQCGPWIPAKTAAGDFLKVQYADTELRCAITRKMIPAGSPVMLIGGMVISQAAFEYWLEEQLAGMIGRHQDLHTDSGSYDE